MAWAYLFLSPFIFDHHEESWYWQRYVQILPLPLMLFVTFYANYLLLIPRFFLRHRYRPFYIANALIIAFGAIAISSFMHYVVPLLHESIVHSGLGHDIPHPHGHHGHKGMMRGKLIPFGGPFFIRDIISMIFTAAGAMAFRITQEWRSSEERQHQTRLQLADAALRNLKTQISPHFLLNTLNNIYSLTAFDTEQAQHAISELSKMLRYQLYESDDPQVALSKEADFLMHYIALMKLRLPASVTVTTHFDLPSDNSITIAPHVLISLVENAFKHGVSAEEASFINISLEANAERVHFVCSNSNFASRRHSDTTQGGIGLQQVAQRLELVYPHRHSWQHGPSDDGKVYTSDIVLTLVP